MTGDIRPGAGTGAGASGRGCGRPSPHMRPASPSTRKRPARHRPAPPLTTQFLAGPQKQQSDKNGRIRRDPRNLGVRTVAHDAPYATTQPHPQQLCRQPWCDCGAPFRAGCPGRRTTVWGCLTDRGYVMGCGPRRRSDRLWLHHKSLNRWLRPGVSRQTRADSRNRTPRQDLSIGHRQDL